MADSDGLENRCPRKGTVGSNPTLSAKQNLFDPRPDDYLRPPGCFLDLFLMIDKGRRDIVLIYSDIELARAEKCIQLNGKSRKGAGPCATKTFEPRQIRKEATVPAIPLCRRAT